MLFNDERIACQFEHVNVGDRKLVALGVRHIDRDGGLASLGLVAEHHLDQFGANAAAHDGRFAQRQRRLVHVKLVGVDRTLHHTFAQAIARGDEHHVGETGFSIDGEHHTGCAAVGAHHALHAGRQRHFCVGKTLVHAIRNRAVVVERGKDFAHRFQHVVNADDVEEGFLLPGKRCIGQVFSGSRGTHCDADCGATGLLLHRRISRANRRFKCGRQRLRNHPGANLPSGCGKRLHIRHIEVFQTRFDTRRQPFMGQKIAVGIGSGGKSARHAHTRIGQLADHFAERGVLAADAADIGIAQLFKRHHVLLARHEIPLMCAAHKVRTFYSFRAFCCTATNREITVCPRIWVASCNS